VLSIRLAIIYNAATSFQNGIEKKKNNAGVRVIEIQFDCISF